MKSASFDEVQLTYLSVKKNMYQQWTVNRANARSNGNWALVELSKEDHPRIILPHRLLAWALFGKGHNMPAYVAQS